MFQTFAFLRTLGDRCNGAVALKHDIQSELPRRLLVIALRRTQGG